MEAIEELRSQMDLRLNLILNQIILEIVYLELYIIKLLEELFLKISKTVYLQISMLAKKKINLEIISQAQFIKWFNQIISLKAKILILIK